MANYTENYNLKKPDQDDFYNVEDQNENMDKIDAELKTLADSMDGSDVVNAVSEVSTKIGENTDTAGTITVFARLKQIYDYLVSVLSSTRAAKIDNLDAVVSSRQASWGATTTHAGRIDAAISSRASQVSVNAISTNVGSNVDAASATGSLHAKIKDIKDFIALNGSPIKSIQRGRINGNSSGSVVISIANIDPSKCFVNIQGFFLSSSSSSGFTAMPYLFSLTSTALEVRRSGQDGSVTHPFSWEVIEFN